MSLRVVQVVHSLSTSQGGTAVYVAGLARALAVGEAEISLFAAASKGEKDTLNPPGVRTMVLPESPPISKLWTAYTRSMAQQLEAAIREADIVHIHNLWHYPMYLAAKACRRNATPYVLSPHGTLSPRALHNKRLTKKVAMRVYQADVMRRANAIHALNDDERGNVRAQVGDHPPTYVIPIGIRTDKFTPAAGPDGQEATGLPLQRARKGPVLLFVGRIHPIKGLSTLAESFIQVQREHPGTHLILTGPDSDGYASRLRSMFQAAGILGNVSFTGQLAGKDLLAIYRDADLFVLPSITEAQSLSLLEAMSCGLPVIATRSAAHGVVEAADAGVETNRDAGELAAAISATIESPERALRMGANAREYAKRYDWSVAADRMIDLYERILDQQARNR